MEDKTFTPTGDMTVAVDSGERQKGIDFDGFTVAISDAFMQDAIDAVLAREQPGTRTYAYVTKADPRVRLRTVQTDDDVAALYPDEFVLAVIAGDDDYSGDTDPAWVTITDLYDLDEMASSVSALRTLIGHTVWSFITYDLARYDPEIQVIPVQEGDEAYDRIVAALPPMEVE